MRRRIPWLPLAACALALAASAANAAPCPGNPNALGVSRVIAFGARDGLHIGMLDYGRTLPLAAGEVVLTFDDGPRPPYTEAVLHALAKECVRAVFFMVGRQAVKFPELARHVQRLGHTVGTHTQNHPLYRMPRQVAAREIDAGIASVAAALRPGTPAPYFRFPGLFRSPQGEAVLRERRIVSWSIDVDTHDWKRRITPDQWIARTMAQLDARRGGIVLMHDIQPVTALVLPRFLATLKTAGYRTVHVVPAAAPGHGPLQDLIAGASGLVRGVAAPAEAAGAVLKHGAAQPVPAAEVRAPGRVLAPFERVHTLDGRPLYR